MSEVIDLNERREAYEAHSEARQSDFVRLAFSHETPALSLHYRDESGQLQRLSVSATQQLHSAELEDVLAVQLQHAVVLLGGRLESTECIHSYPREILYA